ncbi:MAG: helix-turn-helix domain-containing protein [Thermoleophilia bacterium]|nr:helix-turn-helix domain-containing protein [Thermoleophilia bacterium]
MAAAPDTEHPTRRSVEHHLRARTDGAGVEEIADALGLHPNTVRFHLARLVEDGRATWKEGPPRGRGRPRRRYAARPDMDRDGRRDYLTLARMALDGIAHVPDAAAVAHGAGRRWGASVAARASRGAGLESALDGLGFAPRRAAGGGAIDLHQCPFLDAVDSHGELVCQAHLGLMRALAEALEPGVRIERVEPFARPGVCVATLAGPRHTDDERTPA